MPRGGLALVVAVLGLALSSAAHLWWGTSASALLAVIGVIAARGIVMTLVGVDADAVVERTWTTRYRGSESHHCILRRTDGTPIPHRLASDCEGHERGDTVPVVLDPRGRFAPVDGPKADLPVAGESQVAAVGGLLLLASFAIGSAPARE